LFLDWKKLLHTPIYGGRNTSPQTYENGFFLPTELSKIGQIAPDVALDNHNKLQKIIK
jgi:hypothetical protein